MDHLFFIAAAYGVSALGLGALIGWALWSYRHEQRLLADLEARGVRRRARRKPADDTAPRPLVENE